MPPLLLLLTVVCFPAYWLNTSYIRQQLTELSAEHGVILSYGEISSFYWWSGLSLDQLQLGQDGVDVRFDAVNYSWTEGLRVQQGRVELPAALFQAGASERQRSEPVDFPAILALLPRNIAFETFELAVQQGAVYQGSLKLALNGQLGLETALDGFWSLPSDSGESLRGPLTTSFELDLVKQRLTLNSLSAAHAGSSITIQQAVVNSLLESPQVTGALLQASLHSESLQVLFSQWLPDPDISRFKQINVQLDRFSFDGSSADMLLKELRLEGSGGSQAVLSGPLRWQGGAGGEQQLNSPGLALLTDLSKPERWGIPLKKAIHWRGDVQFSLSVGEESMLGLHSLGLKGTLLFGDKNEAERWQTDFSLQELQLSEQQADWAMATLLLLGEKDLHIADQKITAGRYNLQLSDSTLTFEKEGKIAWHTRGFLDMAMQGLPAFSWNAQSEGSRQAKSTRIGRLNLQEKKQGLSVSLQGVIHDAGVDHRASRLKGKLEVKNLAALQPWLANYPPIEGAAALDWSSLGLGMGRLQSKGEFKLLNLSLQLGEQFGKLHVDGASLNLPFKQTFDHWMPEVGKEMNRAQLYTLGDVQLPGHFTLKSASLNRIHLHDLKLGLSLQDGLLIGRIDQGSLLEGSLAGAFMLRYPSEGSQRYPQLFSRLSLLHANSAGLLSEKGYAASHLNLYTTLQSDGSDLSGRFSVPEINRDSLEQLMDWIDPKRQQASLQSVRQAMDQYGYAPSAVDARLRERYLDVDVELQSRQGSRMQIPVHNLSVGHLLDAQ